LFDESLLDDPEALARADGRGLLRTTAGAGARVRTGLRLADEAGVSALRPDGRPRALLVAGTGPQAAAVADQLAALCAGSCPVELLHPDGPAPEQARWRLPGWANPLDLLLLVSPRGTESGLTDLVEQSYRRGCTACAVSPTGSPLADAVAQVRGMALPYAEDFGAADGRSPRLPGWDPDAPGTAAAAAAPAATEAGTVELGTTDPGAFWAMLTPLLALTDRLGLTSAPADTLRALADRLDEAATRYGPAVATYGNPAKTLAAELDESLPLIWSQGPVAHAAARRFAAALAALARRPALAATLPTALTAHGPLLAGAAALAADPDDFFRDRLEDPGALRVRVVLLQEAPDRPGSAAPAARELAYAHSTPLSELTAPGGSPLETAAELLALTDFATAYLAVATTERPWTE
jgi:hypothetical protein